MRKVKFVVNGKDYDGYYIGIAGVGNDTDGIQTSLIVVEDFEGNVFCIQNSDVKFVGKPVNPTPKVIDLKFMRNAIEGWPYEECPFTMQQLIDLAVERNIIIYDTEGFKN